MFYKTFLNQSKQSVKNPTWLEDTNKLDAHYVAQVNDNGKNIGWIVFQFEINAINSTLSDHSELGETGEIYLTNKDKVMLTQSRLIPENTLLKLKVDTPATEWALKELKGKMLLHDYQETLPI